MIKTLKAPYIRKVSNITINVSFHCFWVKYQNAEKHAKTLNGKTVYIYEKKKKNVYFECFSYCYVEKFIKCKPSILHNIYFFFTCAVAFWYVRSWKTLKRRFWYSFLFIYFFYSYIEYFSSFLVFWLLTCTIALKRYVFCNVVSFSTIGGFACISAFWYLIMWKTLKIHVFIFFW